jgi:hypothetical protein
LYTTTRLRVLHERLAFGELRLRHLLRLALRCGDRPLDLRTELLAAKTRWSSLFVRSPPLCLSRACLGKCSMLSIVIICRKKRKTVARLSVPCAAASLYLAMAATKSSLAKALRPSERSRRAIARAASSSADATACQKRPSFWSAFSYVLFVPRLSW